jgi:hypothetical protein
MKKFYQLFAFVLFSLSAFAQPYSLDWVNIYPSLQNHGISTVDETPDGNLLIQGRYVGAADIDASNSLKILSPNDSGYFAHFIGKISNSGNLIWGVGIKNPAISVSGVYQHPAGDIFVICHPGHRADSVTIETNNHELKHYSITPNGAFLMKFSSSGQFLGFISFQVTGSYPYLVIDDITFDKQGHLLLAGTFRGTVDFDNSAGTQSRTAISDLFLLKINSFGQYIWVKTYDAKGDACRAGQIIYDHSGNIIMTGHYNDSLTLIPNEKMYSTDTVSTLTGIRNLFLARFDSVGIPIFAHSINTADVVLAEMVCDTHGNITLAGMFNDSLSLNNTAKLFPYLNTNTGYGYVIQFNNTGTVKWSHFLQPAGGVATYRGLRIDTSGNLYLSGNLTQSVLDLDPGSGVVNISATDGNFFIQKLDKDGDYLWSHQFRGKCSGAISFVDDSNNLHINGAFTDSVDFDPTVSKYISVSSRKTTEDAFLLKFKNCPTSTGQKKIGSCSPISYKGVTYNQSTFVMDSLNGTASCDSMVRVEMHIGNIDTAITFRSDSALVSNQVMATSFQWVDCNDNYKPIPGETSQHFKPMVNGNYAVLITRDSCSEYSACYNYQIVSIDEFDQGALTLFPNPTKDVLTVDFGTAFEGEGEIVIYNAAGQVVIHKPGATEAETKVSLAGLPAGVYAVKARTGNRYLHSKVVKE